MAITEILFLVDSGSIIIRIEGIHSSSILADEGVTVSGNVENKVQRSVDFTTAVYDNPEKTTHEEYHFKPAQRLEIYYELMIFIILNSSCNVYCVHYFG